VQTKTIGKTRKVAEWLVLFSCNAECKTKIYEGDWWMDKWYR